MRFFASVSSLNFASSRCPEKRLRSGSWFHTAPKQTPSRSTHDRFFRPQWGAHKVPAASDSWEEVQTYCVHVCFRVKVPSEVPSVIMGGRCQNCCKDEECAGKDIGTQR